mmetsp:Transcript_50021/g.106439  ORF Transcript_50021/g.106439 Transcript_50021/m.106439 type:complete len:508 (+) Transcript_50021:98-1621(+)
MKVSPWVTLVFLPTSVAQAQGGCVDEPEDVVNALVEAATGIAVTGGCASQLLQNAIEGDTCAEATERGGALRANCCRSCLDRHFPMPETQLPEDGGLFGEPVKLYLQAGQSECVGQASVRLLDQHSDATGDYSDLVVEQDGVFVAGYNEVKILGTPDESRYFIAKMGPNKEGLANNFGPEIAIGRRLQDASPTNTDIMIVKYCWGGSAVATKWNPASAANSWDRASDDGTSGYLLSTGAADLTNKDNLYGNLIYTARRTQEELDAANVDYEWSGLFWIQGNADRENTWEGFGVDTRRLFDRVRSDLGVADLPIVDTGADVVHHLYSGKIHSASTIPNCNVKVAQSGEMVVDPSTDCVPNANSACPTFTNFSFYEHYGLDPRLAVPPYSDGLPDSLLDLNKTFTWYKAYPNNLHSEYDGMILKGNMVANEFIRTFTDWTLTPEMTEDDPILLFPPKSCGRPGDPGYTEPSNETICFIDMRDDDAIDAITCDVETGEVLQRRLGANGRQ